MLKEILIIAAVTFLPFLELRASIPYGLIQYSEISPIIVILTCVITNMILGPMIYIFLDKFIHLFLRINIINKIYSHYVEKTQKKIHKYVEKYGELGVSIFIGIPLPGSGSYSGALGSYLLGLPLKKFIIANAIGVLIAGTAVSLVVITGSELFHIFIKTI